MELTAIVGAGPYGLSVAAHLHHHRLPVRIFGRPMETWQQMPEGMILKSSWSASSLSDPEGAHGLDRFCASLRGVPIPLPMFREYCDWFRERAVPEVDETCVRLVRAKGDGFRLTLDDGREVAASRVVVAAGISRFAHLPDFVAGLPPRLASHTSAHREFAGFAGADVIVVGAGQSALESAALLSEAGATTEVVARSGVTWVDRRLHDASPLLASLLYAPSDVGPAGLSRLVHEQLLLRRLPEPVRGAVTRRCVRPSGANWLRARVEGRVRLTERVWVLSATAAGPGVRLRLSDGGVRHADHLLLGTGYRPDVRALHMLDADLLARVSGGGPLPRLNGWFESAVPRLHFVGGLAEGEFGPLCRFVAGAGQAARQIARRTLADRSS